MIDIWVSHCHHEIAREELSHLLSQLPTPMQLNVLKFRRWQDAQASLIGKLLLRKALMAYGYQPRVLEEVGYNEFNRPYLSNEIDFNISHTGFYVLCAVTSTSRVGIDIEQVHPLSLLDFENQFSADEFTAILSASDQSVKFFDYWTMKEAIAKADGRGLSLPLKSIAICENGTAIVNRLSWYVSAIDIAENYRCHIASDKPVQGRIRLHEVSVLQDSNFV